MIKLGAKVLDKISNDEYQYVGSNEEEDGTTIYTFERKSLGRIFRRTVTPDRVEKMFYFLVEPHPSVKDADRKKNKKKRQKVSQPTHNSEPAALGLLG